MKILIHTAACSLLLLLLNLQAAICAPAETTTQIGDRIKTTLKNTGYNPNSIITASASTGNNSTATPVTTSSSASSPSAVSGVKTSYGTASGIPVSGPKPVEATTYYPISTQQVQPQTRYIPLHYTYKPYYVPQVNPHITPVAGAPTTVLLLAQPTSYIPQALYSAAAQQLVNYYHTNPQARIQLLHQYQNQQQAAASHHHPIYHTAHVNHIPQASYVNYQMVAAPQTTQYQLVAPPTTALAYAGGTHSAAAYDSQPQYRAVAAAAASSQHMTLAQIAQMASLAAQHHSYSSFAGGAGHHASGIHAYSPPSPTPTIVSSHQGVSHYTSPGFGGSESSYQSGGSVGHGGHFYAAPSGSEHQQSASGHPHHSNYQLNTNEYVANDREIPSSSNYNPTYVYKNQFTKG